VISETVVISDFISLVSYDRCQLLVVGYQLWDISYQLWDISCELSVIFYISISWRYSVTITL